MSAYESFLADWGTDYATVRKTYEVETSLPRLFGTGRVHHRRCSNHQVLDYEGLEGRLLSSAYTPSRSDPTCPDMVDSLAAMFAEYSLDGTVRMEYHTDVYFGKPKIS